MNDLFPESLQQEALGADLIPYLRPVFFAIYPAESDLPRIADWQRRLCRQRHPAIAPRPLKLLHVSVADCGKPKRKLRSLRAAIEDAGRHFSFPAFDLEFDATARFGADQQAYVAVVDAAGQEVVHGLRMALADAQRRVGFFVSRGAQQAHLTLGYGDELPESPTPIRPFGFRAASVDLVMTDTGRSRHLQLASWPLA